MAAIALPVSWAIYGMSLLFPGISGWIVFALCELALFWRAEDKTVTGDGTCIKGHQTAIKVQEGDKAVTYYLVENDVSKDFHGKICAKSAKVRASGDVKEATNGRWELTATKIELVKEN
jgi:hypothetical protein